MSALEKPTTPQTETGQIPASEAGILLESLQIHPPEFLILQAAISRINALKKAYGDVSPMVSPDYKKIYIYTVS